MSMKTKDIAKAYNINQMEFEQYLKKEGIDYKLGFIGEIIIEDDVEGQVQKYKEFLANEKKKQEIEKQEKEEEQKKVEENRKLLMEKMLEVHEEKHKKLANMLITSGFNFDGYRIKKYSGYISGDAAISISRGVDGLFSDPINVCDSLTNSLVRIRREAISKLKEAAYDLGCNAVIGVDFDYITLEPETANSRGGTTYLPYVFCVTANGNAVIIEKCED